MMKKSVIDRETVQRIIDTANIVEVVSDFVSLKRRGANYIGLCPFHNERTPSFSVSPAKGICKCFSCGKGGSSVNFVMEHEQMTYWEALRYLAKKYHIEIKEHEMSDEERRQQSERQTLLALNEFAMKHFEQRMAQTDEGRDVGLSYFRHRGINDAAVARFHLGFALEQRDDLAQAALKAGYSKTALEKTGLCFATEHGELRDRFRGRVIYPVFTIAGKVVAFGGRILTNDKKMAKYVNSPESVVYSKSRELYGLYQAKQSIVKKNKCILVEGYMDVISMSQSGIENVVASSGTSLTTGQVRLIHRFTENVTVIYDSDAAGIKASLRGIDLLLAEGLNIKVLLLPDGDDPDSFAQNHSTEEVEQYLAEHEVDFIRFKTDILLKDSQNDPIARAKAVADIVRSISVIPDEITRNVYVRECSQRFAMDEALLTRQVAVARTKRIEQQAEEARRQAARDSIKNLPPTQPAQSSAGQQPGEFPPDEPPMDPHDDAGAQAPAQVVQQAGQGGAAVQPVQGGIAAQPATQPAGDGLTEADYGAFIGKTGKTHKAAILAPQERSLLRLVVKYGMLDLGEDYGTDEQGGLIKVIDYVIEDLEQDGLSFENPELQTIYQTVVEMRRTQWDSDYAAFLQRAAAEKEQNMKAGLDTIAREATDLQDIRQRELMLKERVEEAYRKSLVEYAKQFFRSRLLSHPDDTIRNVTTDLIVDRHQLSKIYTKNNTKVESEEDRLDELVPRALLELKYDIARCFFNELSQQILQMQQQPDYDIDAILELMSQQRRWQQFSSELATKIGERVYEPLR
jgi:DNA primase